jgi:hypothetical protein
MQTLAVNATPHLGLPIHLFNMPRKKASNPIEAGPPAVKSLAA